jgi:N-acetylglutamate synthase-like GNAT family acetyltransferase
MSTDGVTIRVFTPSDQDEVSALYRTGMNGYQYIPIVGQCYAWFVDDKLKPDGDMSNIQRVFMNGAEEGKSCFWVAVVNDKIVGCVGATQTTKYTNDHIELVRMFVSPECRQMAIGRKLIAVLEEWAKAAGYKKIYLSTLGALTEPNQLYPKAGFVLAEAEDFDIAESIGVPSPAIVVGNHYVKEIA